MSRPLVKAKGTIEKPPVEKPLRIRWFTYDKPRLNASYKKVPRQ